MKKIKLFDPFVDSKEKLAVDSVFKSGFWASGSGKGNVSKFEEETKNYIKSKNCVAVNSGTAALNLALSLLDIKDKEVILPSFTFVATANAVILNGGKPVFVDIDPSTLCIDAEKILSSITTKTKAILPVHFSGMPCNLEKLKKISKKNNFTLIEDASHAFGASYKNKKIGSHGDFVCFSFHPVKNLAMPNGGLISINNKKHEFYKNKLFSKRWCGISDRKNYFYDVKEIGDNYYMNEFSASIGRVQLKKIKKMNKIRQKIAKQYNEQLYVEQKIPFSEDCSYHMYWIFVKNRKKFMSKMLEVGIETGIHYRPIHTMSYYKKDLVLPITEKAGKEIVTLPIHPNLKTDDIEYIIKNVNKFI